MKKLILLILALASLPSCVWAQGVRIDPFPASTTAGSPLPGNAYPPMLAIPGALVSVCNYPANGNPCTNFATTYTDASLTTACPNSAQVTLQNSSTCQNSADAAGNFGFWVSAGGNYTYNITLPGSARTYGPYTFTAATAGCPSTGCQFSGAVNGPLINNLYAVGTGGYSNIAAAEAAAGTGGTIYIRSDYAGSDSITNANNLQVIDARKLSDLDFHVWTGISPARPTAKYPLGNDMRVESYGPADLYLAQTPLCTSTTTTLIPGVNSNVLVGSTANFSTDSAAGIFVGEGSTDPNYEVASAFTAVDSTHFNITVANTHSGTTAICQSGSTFLDMSKIQVSPRNPPGVSGYNVPITLYDEGREKILLVPIDLTDPWPYSGLGVGAQVYGNASTLGDFIYRSKTSSAVLRIRASTGADDVTFNEVTGWVFKNIPSLGYRITPATDSEASYFYGTNAADTNTTWRFDNLGAFTDNVSVDAPSLIATASTTSPLYATTSNCSSAASPAICAAAAAGSVVVAASATSVVVNTTAVTANSQIFLQEDSSIGAKLGVTCNTTPATAPPTVSARTAAVSFTITTTAPSTNPRCFSYSVLN